MGCCCSSSRERNRDAELGWHNNNNNNEESSSSSSNPTREMSESDPIETKLELEGNTQQQHTILPAELESPVEATRQQDIVVAGADDPPPYSPGTTTTTTMQRPVIMNRVTTDEPRISNDSNRSIQIGRASEDSGFEKMEQGNTTTAATAPHGESEFDDRKYRGVVL